MLADAEIAAMRETVEQAMPDLVRVYRATTSAPALDPVTGVLSPGAPLPLYVGQGRVRPPTAAQVEVLFGDRQIVKVRYVGTLPFDAGDFQPDDVLIVERSSDPDIAGMSFRVVAVAAGSWQLGRRLALEVVE